MSLITLTGTHHARWSGYPRYAEYLPAPHRPEVVGPSPIPRIGGRRVLSGLAHRLLGPTPFSLDIPAARRLAVGRDELVHVLYGDSDRVIVAGALGVGRRRGNRLIATFHLPPGELRRLDLPSRTYSQLDHAIALGPVQAEFLAGRLGPRRVSLAFLPVDPDAWSPDGPAGEVPTCVFVGSMLRDLDVLERVISAVREARPEVRFEVVSDSVNVARFAGRPGVITHHRISDEALRDLYRRAWVHVLPFGDAVGCNALLEGMACGLATVTTDVGDTESYTEDGAVLAAPGDVAGMTEAVLALLADERRREELGRRARRRAEELSMSAAARRHAEIYAPLVDPI